MSDGLIRFLESAGFPIFLLLVGLGLLIWHAIRIVGETIQARAFEESRREIAAYVAEGSIAPAEAATILAINSPGEEPASEPAKKDPAKKLASLVAWGTINKKQAAMLVEARARMPDDAWAELVTLAGKGMPVPEAIKLVSLRAAPAEDAPAPA